MTSNTGLSLAVPDNNGRVRPTGVLVSISLHVCLVLAILGISHIAYQREQYQRPPTFTLVNFQPPEPEAPAPATPQKATVRQPAAPVQTAPQPRVTEPAPDLTDKNPVPSSEPPVQSPPSEQTQGSPSGPAQGAVDAGQPVAIGSTAVLDNTSFAPIYNPKPAYPAIAIKAGIEGYVDVELVVTPGGFIESFSILKVWGHPSFGVETAQVIRKWRFPPPRISGKAVRIKYDYRVNFTLD